MIGTHMFYRETSLRLRIRGLLLCSSSTIAASNENDWPYKKTSVGHNSMKMRIENKKIPIGSDHAVDTNKQYH